MARFPFNVRVYFLLFDPSNEFVLIAEEVVKGLPIIKFPGGGLEFGEGTIACAMREAREELGIDILVTSHFYTTDFFIESAFNPEHQVISIYYQAWYPESDARPSWTTNTAESHRCIETGETFRWRKLADMKPSDVTFPGDQEVVRRLLGL